MQLYYHKTSGGAEYLTDTFILCENGHKEGTFEGAQYIVRIDGDIEKDAELTITSNNDLLAACERYLSEMEIGDEGQRDIETAENMMRAAIAKAKGGA